MLLFLTVVLILSSLAMMLLLYTKHWELSTGRMLFPRLRPHMSGVSGRVLHALEHHMPAILTRLSHQVWRWFRTGARELVTRILIATEHSLESILDHLKHSLTPPRGMSGPASPFLREVAEHKRKLTRVTRLRKQKVEDIVPSQNSTIVE